MFAKRVNAERSAGEQYKLIKTIHRIVFNVNLKHIVFGKSTFNVNCYATTKASKKQFKLANVFVHAG